MKKKFIYLNIIFILLVLSSCKVSRFVYYNFANITDHNIFPKRIIKKDSSNIYNFKKRNHKELEGGNSFDDLLEDNKTVAFVIIQNDTVKYEKYFNKYNRESIISSFSMAKSITSILIGCAIDDGFIESESDLIINYIPELKQNGFENISIKDLLQMTSNLDFNESYYNPFGDAATFYYGRNLTNATLKLKLKKLENKRFEYTSGEAQLLGLVLERALKGVTISKYLETKIWIPLGMEYDASWSIDKKNNGIEKTFCCLNARAIDFAKIGRLYLQKGNWNGNQIVSESWIKKSTQFDNSDKSDFEYQYQWWIPNNKGDYIAKGILGQYIFVSPEKNLIIVRLGKNYGNVNWERMFSQIKKKF